MRTKVLQQLVCLITSVAAHQDLPPPCDNEIYCIGGDNTLLHTVQMSRIYEDSKKFVDMPLKLPPAVVQQNFENLMQETEEKPSKDDVLHFVEANFHPEGTEFQDWEPEDWSEDVVILEQIADQHYLNMTRFLHKRWLDLGRLIKKDVREDPSRFSLIYVDKPFIVPGGRFRECYYWDSYWTILGLLVSEMHKTVRGMLENFSQLVEEYGFIPNGNRIYYSRRSQPPLFIAMVDEYVKETDDLDFVKENIDIMAREFDFWINNRMTSVSVEGKDYPVAHYLVNVDGPRPESYLEDYRDANSFFDQDERRQQFYIDIKSGAESGWDFSSKWFIPDDPNQSTSSKLKDIQTHHVVPVELNAFMCRNARVLANFYEKLGNSEASKEYLEWYKTFENSIDKIMWNHTIGLWFDYDMKNNRQRNADDNFYPSNFAPLWADCYRQTKNMEKIKKVVKFIADRDLMSIPVGIQTSFVHDSGQQWDGWNAWPPMQEVVITGLLNSGYYQAECMALQIARKWVKNGYLAFKETAEATGEPAFFEKYSVSDIGAPGEGGEYTVQEGFGWTNGVFLYLLDIYGDVLSSEDSVNAGTQGLASTPFVSLCVLSSWMLTQSLK